MVISSTGQYHTVWSCAKIESALPSPSMLLEMYPTCAPYADGSNPDELAIVLANLDGDTGVNAGAALNMSFGMALWLSVVIHAIGVEIYVSCSHKPPQHKTHTSNIHPAPPDSQRSPTPPPNQLPAPTRSRHAQPWLSGPDRRSSGRRGSVATGDQDATRQHRLLCQHPDPCYHRAREISSVGA
jgi:hypothetical protein